MVSAQKIATIIIFGLGEEVCTVSGTQEFLPIIINIIFILFIYIYDIHCIAKYTHPFLRGGN